jgi:4'-phosphopantetheinyl transferase
MMRESAVRDEGLCEIWVVRIGDEPVPPGLAGVLSPEERARAARFVREADRRRFEQSHVALRRILADWLGEAPGQLAFVAGPWGKPALAEPFAGTGVEFNLSHTNGVALVAVARGRRVGIDIEAVRPLGDMPAIARRVLSEADCRFLEALPAQRAIEVFWQAWTANEACLKAVGSGLGAGEPAIRLDQENRPVPRDPVLQLHALGLAPFVGALAIENGAHARLVMRDLPPAGPCLTSHHTRQ